MSKKTTPAPADDLLGGTTAPAAATATKVVKKPAKSKTPATPADDLLGGAATPATPAKKATSPKEPKEREAIHFDEGEREAYEKAIKRIAKNPIITRELNKKLTWGDKTGMPGRKLRDVLYAMQRKGAVVLTPGANRAAGMTVALPSPEQAEAFKAKKAEQAERAKKADAPAA